MQHRCAMLLVLFVARTAMGGPEARNLGMGVYFTWYYAGMAILPGLAGWCRDLSGVAAAPLVFASFLVVIAIVCPVLFRRLEKRSMSLAAQRCAMDNCPPPNLLLQPTSRKRPAAE